MRMLCKMLRAQIISSLILPTWVSAETAATQFENELIERKAQLGYQMLGQLKVPDAIQLRDKLTALTDPEDSSDIELRLQKIDSLLAKIADLYRQRHDRKELLAEQDKTRYLSRQEEIRSLLENLEVASDKNESHELEAMKHAFQNAYDEASALADSGDYTQALPVIEHAREKLVLAITSLNQARTIEYRLEFADISEEYEYELRRYASQMMLLHLAMQERPPAPAMAERIEASLNTARALNEEAREFAVSERYQTALDRQESAVGELNSILRLMGYFF